ncbi:hypothetical protein L9F63_017689, partial [Diploptera punctata]
KSRCSIRGLHIPRSQTSQAALRPVSSLTHMYCSLEYQYSLFYIIHWTSLSSLTQFWAILCHCATSIYNFKHFNIFYTRNYTIFEHSDSPRKWKNYEALLVATRDVLRQLPSVNNCTYSLNGEEEEETPVDTPRHSVIVVEEKGDPEFVKRQEQKSSALDEQLKEYIAEWRKQRAKEEEDLKKLKEKQSKRKVMRADEEKRMAERKKQEEERRVREIEEKKQRDIEEKRRRLEEAEKKRQAMMQALKEQKAQKGPNFTIQKKDAAFSMSSAQMERNKTKEQLEEEKKISLSFRIKPLEIENLSVDKLKSKAAELWDCIVKLETEKYDLEERQKRQDYDLKELKERQKQQLRHKALKKGLDPEKLFEQSLK